MSRRRRTCEYEINAPAYSRVGGVPLFWTDHAIERMAARGITPEEVVAAMSAEPVKVRVIRTLPLGHKQVMRFGGVILVLTVTEGSLLVLTLYRFGSVPE